MLRRASTSTGFVRWKSKPDSLDRSSSPPPELPGMAIRSVASISGIEQFQRSRFGFLGRAFILPRRTKWPKRQRHSHSAALIGTGAERTDRPAVELDDSLHQ